MYGAVQQLSPAERSRLRVTLLDLDEEALDARRSAPGTAAGRRPTACRRENLFRLTQPGRAAADLAEVDFLGCSGLFDYLEEDTATALLSRFWTALRPGGTSLVFNFAPENPSRAYMEWIGNWYLKYRTPADMQRLAAGTAIPPGCVTVAAEASGVNLYWELRRQ